MRDTPLYKRFVQYLVQDLRKRCNRMGVNPHVTGRPKELDSLLKKLLIKPHLTYETLSDKAGVRAVVALGGEIPTVRKIVEDGYRVIKVDDKTAELKVDQFNYQGVHLDVQLRGLDDSELEFRDLLAEIQVRTKAQNLWSELNHDVAYKTNIGLPVTLRRRFFNLVALLEMVDREVESLDGDIRSLPNALALTVLSALERQFYKHQPVGYSKELSVTVIEALEPLYGFTVSLYANHFSDFRERNAPKLDVVFRECVGRSLFLSQPEVLMIFDLLERNLEGLKAQWTERFPFDELEELGRIWNRPLS